MARKSYPDDLKTLFGASTMGVSQVVATAMITGTLMLYLTDYAGLFTGIAGQAAAVATVMLVAGRVWDAVNDPILGFVMDRSPRTRWGRFKPFAMVAIPASSIALIALFNLPKGLPDWTKVALMYVLYFAFDALFTLLPIIPLIQSASPHARVRSKLLGGSRIVTLIFAMASSAFMAIAIALGTERDPNIGLAVVVFMVPVTLLSMAGLAVFKEGTANVNEETVRVRDIIEMFKTNKPLWISQLAGIFNGFVWNMLFAGSGYYVKYAFGVENFGLTMGLMGLLMIAGNLIGVFIVQPVLKRMTPGNTMIAVTLLAAIPLGILFVINLAGPITNMALFFGILFVAMLAIGMGYIPGSLLTMECMDYNKHTLGKSLEGSLNSVAQFVQKMQGALAAAVTGGILVAIGYDAERYKDATTIPAELFSGLGLAMFGLPALCAIAAAVILRWYPLRHRAVRDAMYAAISVEEPRDADPVPVNAGEAVAGAYGLPVADEEKQ